MVPVLRESSYVPERAPKWGVLLRMPFVRGLRRVADRLQAADAQVEDPDRHRRRLAALRRLEPLADDVYGIMMRAAAAHEPAGVIVHGDFCRNNMQFVYGDDDQPSRVRFFDFQNSRWVPLPCPGPEGGSTKRGRIRALNRRALIISGSSRLI